MELEETISHILNTLNYIKFEQWIASIPDTHKKGRIQEIFAKIYFLSHRKHYNIKNYYSRLLDSIPDEIMVHEKDVGSDGIIIHTDNTISLVQVKYRTNKSNTMLRGHISNMSLEAIALKKQFNRMYLFSNTYYEPKIINSNERKFVKYVMADTLNDAIGI